MNDSEVVELKISGFRADILIKRETALNALNLEVLGGLQLAINKLNTTLKTSPEGAPRVVTISGSGEKAFVAGADIKLMHGKSANEVREFITLGQQVMNQLEALPLPVIAVVDGFAIGGGLELALSCDLIVVSERAKLGQAEVNLGIIPGFGGTQRLFRRVGAGMAKRLIFTAENITGEEAYRIGLADYFVTQAELETRVNAICELISQKGPLAVAAAKRAIQFGYEPAAGAGLKNEVEEFIKTFSTVDGNEGLSAFVEKRKPQFIGK